MWKIIITKETLNTVFSYLSGFLNSITTSCNKKCWKYNFNSF